MNTITSFFTNIRFIFFEGHTEWEIYNRIAPHLHCERDYGYPFDSDEELDKFCQDSEIAALPFVQEIELDIARMPKGYGKAFRFILFRELKARKSMSRTRIKMFKMLARQRIYPETCDPRFIARRAT